MLTPDEASRTWCPMARIARREATDPAKLGQGADQVLIAGVNRDALARSTMIDFPHSCRCLADKCAMWRWVERQEMANVVKNDGPSPDRQFYTSREFVIANPTHGFCGLAGFPPTMKKP